MSANRRGESLAYCIYVLSFLSVLLIISGWGPFFVAGLSIDMSIIGFSFYVGNGRRLALGPMVLSFLVVARRVSIAKLLVIAIALVIYYPSVPGTVTRRKIERLAKASDDIARFAGRYLQKTGVAPDSFEVLALPRELKVDPFGDGDRLLTWYPCRSVVVVQSVGPDRIPEATVPAAICDLEFRADVSIWLEAQGIRVYDPSNGTRSGGDIFITRSY